MIDHLYNAVNTDLIFLGVFKLNGKMDDIQLRLEESF